MKTIFSKISENSDDLFNLEFHTRVKFKVGGAYKFRVKSDDLSLFSFRNSGGLQTIIETDSQTFRGWKDFEMNVEAGFVEF